MIQQTRPETDLILPFEVARLDLRGRFVRLDSVIDDVITRHRYPKPVGQLLAEMLTLTAAIASGLKYDGISTLQIRGDGPIELLVADYISPGKMRGYAQFDPHGVAAADQQHKQPGLLRRLVGQGALVFTADPDGDAERYQGIVELVGDTLAESMAEYFRQSEQIPTEIRVAGALTEQGWRGGCLLVQQLPTRNKSTAQIDEDWTMTQALMGTVKAAELLDFEMVADRLIHNLFHENDYRLHNLHHPAFGCRCTRERVLQVLHSFPRHELMDMEVDGRIVVNCEFCNATYIFTQSQLLDSPANDDEKLDAPPSP